jgi:uncharacterized protein (TIGR00255 family)
MIRSMTGFAQCLGEAGATRWSWDVKTINAKGLDLRLRLPPGFDAAEIAWRRRIGATLTRGTCHAALSLSRATAAAPARINVALLESLVAALARVPLPTGVGPATLDGLLGVRGVIETEERGLDEAEMAALHAACDEGLEAALAALVAMREGEGAALATILDERLASIGRLTARADCAPQRQPAAVREKLAQSIAVLGERHGLDPERLHQEALLLAGKADVREELDRLAAHVTAARALLATGGAVGRRLDFLAQELAREASTYCAKANDAALTAIGLELRVEIEQFREQVQNIE